MFIGKVVGTCRNFLMNSVTGKHVMCSAQFRELHTPRKAGILGDDESCLQGYDGEQVRLMKEVCILVDEDDQAIGSSMKKDCHLLDNINKGMLHRAFSVLLFNSQSELLLQQRADVKITFPGMFTNSCCSHPLSTQLELEEENAIGVKRAAQRKLFHELGITPDQVPLNTFHYVTRILYKSENIPQDNKFGEYELDYVLIVKKDVSISHNVNEVKSYKYVSQDLLRELLADQGKQLFTPWFRLICEHFLFDWWKNMDNMKAIEDHKTIHRFC